VDNGVEPAGPNDWRRLGMVVGSAFAEDAVSRWSLGDAPMIVATFTMLARHVYLRRGRCYMIGDTAGAMWLDVGASKALPLLPTGLLAARMILRSPRSIARALALDAAMQARRPAAPHRYLFAVGVAEAARGQGFGRLLLAPMLADCDQHGIAAYLENSNPRNASLYQSLGFVAGEAFSPPGCPPLMPMWREPGDRASSQG